MNGALTGTVLVLLWGTVLIRLPTLWRNARQRAAWATLCALALTKTVATPAVNALLAHLVPQPRIIPHLFGVAAAHFLIRFISLITDYDAERPRAARYQLLVAAGVLALLIALAATTPGGVKTTTTELLATPAALASTAYWVVLNGYLGAVLGLATVLFWRISRSAPAGLLGNGLRVIAVGTLTVALYATLKTLLIVLHGFGVTIGVNTIEPVANGLRNLGAILCVVGTAVPATNRLRSAIQAHRSLRALRPLWLVMRRAFPEVILFSRRRALVELAGVDDVRLRLYRRVIEIRDGMLALRGHLPEGTLQQARAAVGERPALVEACGIAVALHRLRAGQLPVANSDHWTDVGGELAGEVAWLTAVSAAYRRREPSEFAGKHGADHLPSRTM